MAHVMIDTPTTPEARQRLVECIAKMARAIDAEECDPEPVELEALAAICDQAQCPAEAARVRRWLGR